jgi:pyroglutamyl-peptidase
MPATILVTGFGPFPGAPFNPTGPLVERLARTRRRGLTDTKIVAHVFPTSYAAVDRDLPRLIAQHRPDALLMFGLAPQAKTIRIETRACNAVSLLPDAGGGALKRHAIDPGAPATIALPAPARHLLTVVRSSHVPATLSRNAGRYLCNYLCWRAAQAAAKPGGPPVAAFVHVPKVRRTPVPSGRVKNRLLTPTDLARAGGAILAAVAVAAQR